MVSITNAELSLPDANEKRTVNWKSLKEIGNIGTKSVNQFHAIGLSLYPVKTVESQRFSDVSRGTKESTGLNWV